MEIFGIPTAALFGQLLIGLINGSFYALLSLGLAVIFGLLNISNFVATRFRPQATPASDWRGGARLRRGARPA